MTTLRAALAEPVPKTVRLQGGLDNDELLEAWESKVPGVRPSEKELTAFALGVEVGDALRAALAEPVQEPVAWTGYDLDAMVEAFDRVIEAHFSKAHPFHDPTNMDAKMALSILRGFIPAMKAYTAPPQRKPLTDDQLDDIAVAARKGNLYDLRIAIEQAHGIGDKE